MADEQYGWLDRETAERLLRGQSPDAVRADARGQAEQLAEVLAALSATPAPTSAELPGEAAALAAFRSARAERPAARGAAVRGGASDAGLVRLGGGDGAAGAVRRPRWARPLRYGLAAALAAGMVGGVAVAAGTGVLPTPFDDAEPAPAASVSAAATPRQPLVTPSPDSSGLSPRPDGSVGGGSAGRDTARDTGGTGTLGRDRTTPGGSDVGQGTADTRREAVASCRAVRDGRSLDAGRKRALEGVAGGSTRVWTYCKGLLGEADGGSKDTSGGTSQDTGKNGGTGGTGKDGNGGGDSDDKDEPGNGNGNGNGGGQSGGGSQIGDGDQVGGGSGGSGGSRDRTGDGHRRRDRSTSRPPAFGPALPEPTSGSPRSSQPSPNPPYTSL
ncbi:hypothetical protein RKD23_002919 [Streptomyces sp. SAI-170]|uniref:hypothetical protein n=1 Tax=Streptomyces sp. SAI-170 TaxID=3377729 RepID=UPI003C7E7F2A